MQASRFRKRKRELTHRPRNADVTQTPFLFHSAGLFRGGHPAHLAILGSRSIKGAIEWLNLAGLETGEYELFCGPLRVVAGEAAPCRVFLRRP